MQGAFARAVRAATDAIVDRALARQLPQVVRTTPLADLPDPFLLFDDGRDTMRARLSALPRPMLLDIITEFGLNPAGKSLSWLGDHQLVTFIVTAVEAQIRSGRRPV